jgi:hypothetical protein
MSTAQFYLLGKAPSSARQVEISKSADFEELQHVVAAAFAIVEPKGRIALSPKCGRG